MGEKLADKIMGNVQASKERPLPRLLFALGILHVGSEVAELLAQRYSSLAELAQAGQEDLTGISGIGPKIAESVAAYFQVSHNQQVIRRLEGAGVKLSHEIQISGPDDLPYHGLTFVVTGTLSSLTRREAESRIKELGGGITSSVTRKTAYLVVGESPGSKLESAQRLGTTVLDEAAFLELLARGSLEPVP